MIKVILPSILLAISVFLPVSAQESRDKYSPNPSHFGSPIGHWIETDAGMKVAHIIVQDREGELLIELFSDGGRFVISQRCDRRGRSFQEFTRTVISTDGGNGFMRNCDGTYNVIRRHIAVNALLQRLRNTGHVPTSVDMYLLQLEAQLAIRNSILETGE